MNLTPMKLLICWECRQRTLKSKDSRSSKKTGKVRIAKAGLWRLHAKDREPEDMDGQIEELLSQATPDLKIWQDLAKRYHIDLFCGLFFRLQQ